MDDVSQQWTSLGLERQRLDDLLELVSIATGPGGAEEAPAAATEDDAAGADVAKNDAANTIVDWSKLLALAAGQLGDVSMEPFYFCSQPCPSYIRQAENGSYYFHNP